MAVCPNWCFSIHPSILLAWVLLWMSYFWLFAVPPAAGYSFFFSPSSPHFYLKGFGTLSDWLTVCTAYLRAHRKERNGRVFWNHTLLNSNNLLFIMELFPSLSLTFSLSFGNFQFFFEFYHHIIKFYLSFSFRFNYKFLRWHGLYPKFLSKDQPSEDQQAKPVKLLGTDWSYKTAGG